MTDPTYEPRGRVTKWLHAMESDPARIWTPEEAADVMGVRPGAVAAYARHAVEAGRMYRGRRDGYTVYSLRPFPPHMQDVGPKKRRSGNDGQRSTWNPIDDLRVPRVVPGWQPPVMVAPRGMAR